MKKILLILACLMGLVAALWIISYVHPWNYTYRGGKMVYSLSNDRGSLRYVLFENVPEADIFLSYAIDYWVIEIILLGVASPFLWIVLQRHGRNSARGFPVEHK